MEAQSKSPSLNNEEFNSYLKEWIHKWLQIMIGIGAVFYPVFGILDYLVVPPELVQKFWIYRLVTTSVLIIQLLIIHFKKHDYASYLHGYISLLIASVPIIQMTIDLGGFNSGYFQGLSLAILSVNILIPWKPFHSLINGSFTILLYLAFNFFYPHDYDTRNLTSNLFFLFSTVIISTVINYVRYNHIRKEFILRTELNSAREFIAETFGKAVDPRVRDYMLQKNLKPGGEMRIATVLFSDIRSFTTLSEHLRPDQVVNLLNQYFEKMSQCITENGGVVNKYIGDAIMAIFGAPMEMDDHAQKATEAALEMMKVRAQLNEDFKAQGLPALNSGIGIHSGLLLSGNIGSKDRLEYTVIGDTVNQSSRIETLCKKLNHDFLISSVTYELLDKTLQDQCQYRGKVKVKGKKQYINIYSVNY